MVETAETPVVPPPESDTSTDLFFLYAPQENSGISLESEEVALTKWIHEYERDEVASCCMT